MITATRLVIAVHDIAASAAFYREVLGFATRELDGPRLQLYVLGACEIMAGACPDAPPVAAIGDHGYVGYLFVDDVDAIHARAVAAGVEIVKPPRDEPWRVRELGLRTVDGHRLMFAQRLA
jgi:predicted enzyme related to lactoylglutathione lyase